MPDDRARQASGQKECTYLFGPYTLIARQPRLLRADESVAVGRRALVLLVELVRRAGEVVGKRELISRVWPDGHVDDANLRAHVRMLRVALGEEGDTERYIVNVPGRGYAFVAPVRRVGPRSRTPSVIALAPPTPDLPVSLTPMVGRDKIVQGLISRVTECRLVTIAGSGGMGKTTVAVSVARAVAHAFAGVVFFADLSPAKDARQVVTAVAAALRVPIPERDPLPHLAMALRNTRVLLVLDNCEHVLDGVAALAERLLQETAGVHMLATSREALDARGEWVHRLAPLEVPPAGKSITAAEALTYSAVRLFADRAIAGSGAFELTDENADAVAEIVRRLDGMPLAIEFGATHAGHLGVNGFATELRRRVELALRGRRTAASRHQTLAAMLDWSYELLSPSQQRALRELSVFAGAFSPTAAAAVTKADGGPRELAQILADLLAKSMLTHEAGGYRLLETTRAYALARLRESGDHMVVARRHAEFVRDNLRRGDESAQSDGLRRFRQDLGNVRAALDWAFSPEGEDGLAVELTLMAAPYWVRLSMLGECMACIERALLLVTGEDEVTLRLRLALLRPLAAAECFAFGPGSKAGAIWREMLTISETLRDNGWRLEALRGLWFNALNTGAVREALATAERYRRLAGPSATAFERSFGERMVGHALHLLGDHDGARLGLEQMIADYLPALHRPQVVRYHFDQEVTSRMRLGLITWLQGRPDLAMRDVEAAARDALGRGHSPSICFGMVQGAIPVTLLRGDLLATERYLSLLAENAERDALYAFTLIARCVSACVAVRQGGVVFGLNELQRSLETAPLPSLGFMVTPFRAELARALGMAGHVAHGINWIDATLARSEEGEERWYVPELLRIKAGLIAPRDATGAEAVLQRGIELARHQGARSWALRCTTDLAALLQFQDRADEARALLGPLLASFTEGFESADLITAARLLGALGEGAPPHLVRGGAARPPAAAAPPHSSPA